MPQSAISQVKPAAETDSGANRKASRRSNHDAKRSALLDEAARTLNRRGVSQTSLATIAKNVGISRAALYYYVDDQQDLVFQCYVRTCEQLSGLLDAASARNAAPLDTICEFVANTLDDQRPEFASLSDAAYLGDEQRSIVLGLYKGIRATLAELVVQGIECAELRECDARIVASIILGLITWVPVALRWPPAVATPKAALSETIREILRFGIAKERALPPTYSRFDLLPFVTTKGNVFDAEVRASARRETLLASASWLFNQKGVDATSLEEVALRVGVTKKVIYHNMGGKDELVAACYRRAFGLFEFVGRALDGFAGSRLDAVCTGLASLSDASVRPDIAALAPITGHETWSEPVREELQEAVGRLTGFHQTLHATGIAEGSIRKTNVIAVIMMFPGFYEWMPRWAETLRDNERHRAPDEIANFFRLGISAL